ncbi:MAG: toll/interleukin-1 receptor domain-containing protein [Cyanobacteria bacterium P01_F01_bin.53]
MPNQPSIFVCYRRTDSLSETGRIYDHLVMRFGEEHLFKDVDSIPFGVDFRRHLESEITKCDIVIVVIGPTWLTAVDERGNRRLGDPADWVRIEIETALKRDIPVVPLLVRGAMMPNEDELPESLRDLAYRNSALARPDPDFRNDMTRLMNSLQGMGYSPKSVNHTRRKRRGAVEKNSRKNLSERILLRLLSVGCACVLAYFLTAWVNLLANNAFSAGLYVVIWMGLTVFLSFSIYRVLPAIVSRICSLIRR